MQPRHLIHPNEGANARSYFLLNRRPGPYGPLISVMQSLLPTSGKAPAVTVSLCALAGVAEWEKFGALLLRPDISNPGELQMNLRILVVAVAVACPAAPHVGADEIEDRLDAAKTKRQDTIANAAAALLTSFDKEIDAVADRGNLAAVKELRAEKEGFSKGGSFPISKAMQVHLAAYLKARKAAASAMHTAYKSTVVDYTKAKNFEKAELCESAMSAFVESESKLLRGLLDAKSAVAGSSPKSVDAADSLPEWSVRLEKALDELAKLDTSAKRDQAHRELLERLDKELQASSMAVTFVVKDVAGDSYTDKFNISVERWQKHDELANLTSSFGGITGHALTKAEALRLKPGDLMKITGTPRFGIADAGVQNSVALFTFINGRQAYSIYMTKYKLSFARGSAE
jgi:hypothetical protein